MNSTHQLRPFSLRAFKNHLCDVIYKNSSPNVCSLLLNHVSVLSHIYRNHLLMNQAHWSSKAPHCFHQPLMSFVTVQSVMDYNSRKSQGGFVRKQTARMMFTSRDSVRVSSRKNAVPGHSDCNYRLRLWVTWQMFVGLWTHVVDLMASQPCKMQSWSSTGCGVDFKIKALM